MKTGYPLFSDIGMNKLIVNLLHKNYEKAPYKIKKKKKKKRLLALLLSYAVGAQNLILFLAQHQVGFFLEYLDLYLMKFVQIKRRVRRKLSAFWWCKRYSAIWSDSREHSENVFHQNSCTLSG